MKLLCPWCLGELPGKPGQVVKCRHCTSEIFWGGDKPFKTEEEALSASQATPDFEAVIEPPPVPEKTQEGDFSADSWLTSDSPWTTRNLSTDVAENFAENQSPTAVEEHQHPEPLAMPAPLSSRLSPAFRDLYRKEIEAIRGRVEDSPFDVSIDEWWIKWRSTLLAIFCGILICSALFFQWLVLYEAAHPNSTQLRTGGFIAISYAALIFFALLGALLKLNYSATSSVRKRVAWALSVADARVGLSYESALQTQLIKVLTPKQAEALAKHEGELVLDGLTTITPEVAEALAKHEGDLYLSGITTITPEVAEALAKHKGRLSLDGLTELNSVSLAGKLASETSETYELHLSSLIAVTPEVAKALAKCRGLLCINGLTMLTSEAAEALARCQCHLLLTGITELNSVALAEKLVSTSSHLRDLDWCTFFGESYSGVSKEFDRITLITPEVAEVFAKCRSPLSLNGLTTITTRVAEALAKHKGRRLYLNGLTTITPEALKILRANPYIRLPSEFREKP